MPGKNGVPDNGQGDGEAVEQQPELTSGQEWDKAGEDAWAELTGEAEPVKETTDGTVEPSGDRLRDEHGRFVARQKDESQPDVGQQQQQQQAQSSPKVEQQQGQAQPATPPNGWSVRSKSEWEKLPQHVRDDIAKREQEVSSGFVQYAGLKPFADMAAQTGRTIQNVLTDYVGLEHELRTNTDQGLINLGTKLGWTQHEAANHFLRIAQRLGANIGQPGTSGQQQLQQGQDDPVMEMLGPIVQAQLQQHLQPLTQQLGQLTNHFQTQTQAVQTRNLQTAQQVVDQFKADPAHKYYANVEGAIERLLETGMVQRTGDLAVDLKTAYEQACRMHPEISEAIFNGRIAEATGQRRDKERETVSRARAASRSITGSTPSAPIPRSQQLRAKGNGSYDADLQADAEAAWEELTGG